MDGWGRGVRSFPAGTARVFSFAVHVENEQDLVRFQFNQFALSRQETEQQFPENRERSENSRYDEDENSSRIMQGISLI